MPQHPIHVALFAAWVGKHTPPTTHDALTDPKRLSSTPRCGYSFSYPGVAGSAH
jgi:hypothetical protein